MLNLGRVNGWPSGSMIHESFISLFPLEGPRLGASQVHWPNRTSEVGVFDVGDLKLQVMVKIKEATNSWADSRSCISFHIILDSFLLLYLSTFCECRCSSTVPTAFFLRCLIFDDSFEHEVKYWPRSESSPFLVDCQLLHVDMSYRHTISRLCLVMSKWPEDGPISHKMTSK